MVITLPDGYNGATEKFDSMPLAVETKRSQTLLKLCVHNARHLVRWCHIIDYEAALIEAFR